MENNNIPKSISNTDTVNILARIDKLRKIHALNVANRFNLSLTEVKIMGFIRCNELRHGLSDILECHNMGVTSVSRSISRLEERSYIRRRSQQFNQKYVDLMVAGEGNFVASYIILEQKKYLNEVFNGFTHEERVMMGKMPWKIDRNVRHVLMENKIRQERSKME